MQSIDDLANVITDLAPSEQQALLGKVAQLNFQKGLHDLADKYRARLAREGQLNSPAEQIWIDLRRIREQIAEHDYRACVSPSPPSRSGF
jgi:hypothetical protein